jgi:hypothetical protein
MPNFGRKCDLVHILAQKYAKWFDEDFITPKVVWVTGLKKSWEFVFETQMALKFKANPYNLGIFSYECIWVCFLDA